MRATRAVRLSERSIKLACKRFNSSGGAISVPFENPDWSKSAPAGYQYAWLKEADTVTLVPEGWHTSCEREGDSIRYIVSKENPEENQNSFQTGFTVSQWKVGGLPVDAVMDQVSNHNLGLIPSLLLSQLLPGVKEGASPQERMNAIRAQNQSTYLLSFLKDLNIHVVDYKTHNLPNVLHRKSIEFVQYAPSQPESASSPASKEVIEAPEHPEGALEEEKEVLDDTYVLSHTIALPARNSVMSLVLECPLEHYQATKPVFDVVMDHSVLSCHSETSRVLFSDVLLNKGRLGGPQE